MNEEIVHQAVGVEKLCYLCRWRRQGPAQENAQVEVINGNKTSSCYGDGQLGELILHVSVVVVVVNVRYVTNDLENVFPSNHFAHRSESSSSIQTCFHRLSNRMREAPPSAKFLNESIHFFFSF